MKRDHSPVASSPHLSPTSPAEARRRRKRETEEEALLEEMVRTILMREGRVQGDQAEEQRGEVEAERGIPMDLLALWDKEEERRSAGRGRSPLPRAQAPPMFNDELWDHQWYMHDTRGSERMLPEINLHVSEAFRFG